MNAVPRAVERGTPGSRGFMAFEDVAGDPMARPGRRHWRLEDLDLPAIEHAAIVDDEALFYLLVSASFIETGSDTYTSNLAEHYAAHTDVAAWLTGQWEPEELQHGAALKAYVQAVWPEFPWQQAYDSFFAEYAPLCTVDQLEPDPRLELVARCVVETGTTAYYHTLRELSREPVLTDLLGRIRTDEVGHYKHFFQYFRQLQDGQPVGRARVARVLHARLRELRESDSDVALRHVYAHKGRLFARGDPSFEAVSRRLYALVSSRLPADQAVRMLLRPILLPAWLERRLDPPIARLATWIMAP